MLVREAKDSLAEMGAAAVEGRSNETSCVEAGKTVLEGEACARGHHAVIQRLQVEIGQDAEGRSGTFLSPWVHPICPQSWTQCPRTPVCLWRPPRPAPLTCVPFLTHSAACGALVLHAAPASLPQTAVPRWIVRRAQSAGSHHLRTGPLSSHVSFVKRQVWTLFFCLFLAVPPQILRAGFCLDVWQRLDP